MELSPEPLICHALLGLPGLLFSQLIEVGAVSHVETALAEGATSIGPSRARLTTAPNLRRYLSRRLFRRMSMSTQFVMSGSV